MAITTETPDRQVLAEIGDRLARHRLNQNVTQAQLAQEAGVSKRTVVRLENGEPSQVTNLVRVLRALGLLANLNALVPAPSTSPMKALKAKAQERRRAFPASKTAKPSSEWTWGDDKPSRGGCSDE